VYERWILSIERIGLGALFAVAGANKLTKPRFIEAWKQQIAAFVLVNPHGRIFGPSRLEPRR
jgi:hypothetical protein